MDGGNAVANRIRPRRSAQRRFNQRGQKRNEQGHGVTSRHRDPGKPPPRLKPAMSVTSPIRFEDLVPERREPDEPFE